MQPLTNRRKILTATLLSILLPALAAGGPDSYRMKLPDTVWAVSIDLTGFEIDVEELRDDGTGAWVRARNPDTGVELELRLEKKKRDKNSRQCRRKYFRKSVRAAGPSATGMERWEADRLAFGRYRAGESDETHQHVYRGRSDVCLDLHLSKAGFGESDQAAFDAVISSLKIIMME